MDKDPKLRPLYLAQILYERTDEDHYLTTAELMEILEKEHGFKVHRQTIPADVAALRSFGMEIQEVMSSQKRYNLISREYDIAEIKLLIDAVESSKFITKKKSEELVAKLSKMAGRNQAEQLRRNISAEDRIKYDNVTASTRLSMLERRSPSCTSSTMSGRSQSYATTESRGSSARTSWSGTAISITWSACSTARGSGPSAWTGY